MIKVLDCKIRIGGIRADADLGGVEEFGRDSVVPHHPPELSADTRHLAS